MPSQVHVATNHYHCDTSTYDIKYIHGNDFEPNTSTCETSRTPKCHKQKISSLVKCIYCSRILLYVMSLFVVCNIL